MTTPRWDPAQYERYRDERSRPFYDLVARTPADGIATAADLGCGTGELTATLLERWPEATITGVDSSPDMLAKATQFAGDRLRFVAADVATWTPDAPLDAIVSNAALQWVPGHAELIPRLVGLLSPGGTLAFQVPYNRDEPAYRILDELGSEERWQTEGPPPGRFPLETPAWYVETLRGRGCTVSAWTTTYLHQMADAADIVEWIKGSALRPLLTHLGPDEGGVFLAAFHERVAAAYPAGPHGVIFPFRRLFVVAQRGER